MTSRVPGAVAREIRTLFAIGAAGALPDAQLLERFLSRPREEAEMAFAVLVSRHGPMVLATCRRILRDRHDAEDAFQATFLVLVRRAASIARREQLAGWLYGVAVRSAWAARARADRRRAGERRAMEASRGESLQGEGRGELDGLLDEELGRLPDKYRLPVILCDLEGLSRREAAHRLGVPEGTVASRVARGRGLLRDRLQRRGLAPGILAAASRGATEAVVPLMLFETTVRIATSLRFGEVTSGMVPAAVSSIIEGGVRQMLLAKLKIASLALLAVGGVAAAMAQQGPDSTGTNRRPGVSSSPSGRQAAVIEASPRSSADSAPGPVRGVREVLESATGDTAWHRRFFMKVRSESDGPRRLVTEAVIRKDGTKIDYQWADVLVGQPEGYPGNTTNRSIDDGAAWITRSTSVGHKKISGGLAVTNRERHATRAFASWAYGFALDGYLPGNQRKSLVEILTATPRPVAEEQDVDGIRCLRVSANTEYGDVAVWLDPASDYRLRKATLSKQRGNRYDDSRVGEHADTVGFESYTATVSSVEYSRVGRHLIPSSGTLVFAQAPNGRPLERWVISFTRSEVSLDPAYEGTDAFKMDFADGARVSDWDADGRDSYYIWRDGALVPQIEPQRQQVPAGTH